jgi:hypothetical protein
MMANTGLITSFDTPALAYRLRTWAKNAVAALSVRKRVSFDAVIVFLWLAKRG